MASLDQQFRTLLHTHLDRSGTSGRRFGTEALGDPGFVASLAKGRRLGLKTADRVLAFIGLSPLAPAFRREVEAFLRLTGTKVYVLGEGALSDPSFVERLRRDASFRLGTVERVRGWMACRADAAALAAMRDAVAGVPLLSDGPVPSGGPSGECGPQGDRDMKQDDGNYLSTRRAAAFPRPLAAHARPLPGHGRGPGLSPFRQPDSLPPGRPGGLGGCAPGALDLGRRRRFGVAPAEDGLMGARVVNVRRIAPPPVRALVWAGVRVLVPAGVALAASFGLADGAFASTDDTFSGPLDTVSGIVEGTGGQLAAALAVGAALVGSVLRFNAMQLMGAVGVGVAAGAGVGIVTSLVGTAIV